jgi:leukotriene-A4 hydrolase
VNWQHLLDDVRRLEGAGQAGYTALVPEFARGTDPDDVYSSVPYEKGALFLRHLEAQATPARFAGFLQAWIAQHAYGTASSDDLQAAYTRAFPAEAARVDWRAWLHGTGPHPPGLAPAFDEQLARASRALADRWLAGEPGHAGDLERWSSQQLVLLLEHLLAAPADRVAPLLAPLDAAYGLTQRRNAEVRLAWYRLALRADYAPVRGPLLAFLREQGRMKYIRPLYRALAACPAPGSRDLALDTFRQLRASYHAIAAKMVARDLGL